jgi:hydrophobic/amphiphilic exporter-1 (mainly G- bacteria), HAE1 family
MQAALDGTREITLAVLATTATVVAMFLPVAFVPGMVGQFFRQFGNTVIAAVALSMFVAFTLLSHNSLAMSSMIGIILLMGLVTKNGILLVDRATVRVREYGESPLQAVLEAGPERLRPILMTSAAMVMGMLPTGTGTGEGSEFRAPMAIAVIGGLLSSLLLSLVVVPVFYLAIENAKTRIGRWTGRPEGTGAI